jgi:Cation transporting ATPase, C-terminus
MGVVVFSLFNLFFSLESRDRRESVFSLSTFGDRTCIVTTGASLFLLVMATVLAPFQAILKTTALDADQWLLCAAVALSIIAVSEVRKAFLRHTVGPVRLQALHRRGEQSFPDRAGGMPTGADEVGDASRDYELFTSEHDTGTHLGVTIIERGAGDLTLDVATPVPALQTMMLLGLPVKESEWLADLFHRETCTRRFAHHITHHGW